MRPFELLTEEDKELIKQWCINYANAEPQSIEKILSSWNKNKKTLFRAFGKQLRITFPIEVETNQDICKWKKLYLPPVFYDLKDFQVLETDPRNHVFINNMIMWFQEKINNNGIFFEDLRYIFDYLKYFHIERGCISSSYTFEKIDSDKQLKITSGTKIMRAIRKILEFYNFPYMESFCKWRDDISVIGTDKIIKGQLVFSIHPIDFITMSDNTNGWSSCMSWIDGGAYSSGTIEMLNSNVACVVYLESKTPFIYNGIKIPNKSWRTLVFAHKDLLLVGKHYPFNSDTLAFTILDKMQEILKETVKWKYQYKKQLYLDMLYSFDNDYIHYDFRRLTGKHKIYTYMNNMYHDIIEDHDSKYWCCRNYVTKTLYLNLSGPLTCMCCGEQIPERTTDKKYCGKCKELYKCDGCGLISKTHMENHVTFDHKWFFASATQKQRSNIDCLIDNYLWDTVDNLFVKNDPYYTNSNRERYKKLTRERVKSEICCSISKHR